MGKMLFMTGVLIIIKLLFNLWTIKHRSGKSIHNFSVLALLHHGIIISQSYTSAFSQPRGTLIHVCWSETTSITTCWTTSGIRSILSFCAVKEIKKVWSGILLSLFIFLEHTGSFIYSKSISSWLHEIHSKKLMTNIISM